MYVIVDGLVTLLGGATPVLAPERVGTRTPAAAGDLPAAICDVILSDVNSRRVGRIVTAKHVPVQMTTHVTVAPDGAFSPDLRTLLLPPPVRRAPAANGTQGADVTVMNVTDGANPVAYTHAAAPASTAEFRFDLTAARVVFGASQRPGDRLELSFWTVEWHEPTSVDRYRGTLELELWASAAAGVTQLARQVQDRLAQRTTARACGFLRLEPARLHASIATTHLSPTGSSFAAWTQRLAYGFAFEAVLAGEVSGDGIIRRIDVGLEDGLSETLTIGAH
jgi:hypothetical protein